MKRTLTLGLTAVALFFSACSDGGVQGLGEEPGTGGKSTIGDASTVSSGGASGSGGQSAAGGGPGSGGTRTAGGASGSGGVSLGGGASGTGGQTAGGGGPGSGGTRMTGGASGSGGASLGGGASGTGGQTAAGGATGTGGRSAAGGATETGGSKGTGGASSAGGTIGTGGTVATGGSSAAGGTSGGGTCGVSPVTPNASQQVKNVLCYLHSQYGNHVLSGQQEANWNDNPTNVSWYASQGIKTPAVLGNDFTYHSNAGCTGVNISTTHAIAHWNAGGLVMYRYHMGMPVGGTTCANDCYDGTNCSMSTPPSGLLTKVVTAGSAENAALNARLDYMTVQFKAMAAANMPVILAIFHEAQPNGWFWWSMGSGPEFVAMWNYTFNYLTTTKGNTNIIWLMPYSGSPNSAFWPGPSVVDIAGGDTYASNQPFTSLYSSCKGIMGSTMPIALHETGLIPTPSAMFPTAAPWILFSIWAGYETSNNTVANIKAVYSDPHTITRDLLPSFK